MTPDPASRAVRVQAGSRRILVVDDEPAVLEVISRVLSKEGYEVRTAGSAEEGLALLGRESVDLVLLDVQLPRMSGFQAVEAFAKAGAPVLLMSGHADAEFRKDALLLGARDLLEKPVGTDELKAAVKRLASG